MTLNFNHVASPLFAFLNNIAEIRVDAFKWLKHFKRPLPHHACDIGIWLPILSILSKIGVITNVNISLISHKITLTKTLTLKKGLIIAFTSEFIPRLVYRYATDANGMKGYVEFTLSKKLIFSQDMEAGKNVTC